jgi:hypothetical protein
MRKINRLMEHFWLAVAIGTGIAALWMMYMEGLAAGSQWLWFPGIALAMYFFRSFMRGKLEAMRDREQ